MITDVQLLGSITETADMARDSLKHVIDKTENPMLKSALEKQFVQYENIYQSAELLLMSKAGRRPQKTNPALKMYSHLVSDVKAATAEDSTSKIAEMVIQGSTMGITEMTKQLRDYQGDPAVRDLAQRHIKVEQANIEEMKKYL